MRSVFVISVSIEIIYICKALTMNGTLEGTTKYKTVDFNASLVADYNSKYAFTLFYIWAVP